MRQDLTILDWLDLRFTTWFRLVINLQLSHFNVPVPGFEMFVTIYLLYCCLLTAVLGVEVAVGHSLITAPTVVYNRYNAFEVNENEIPKGDIL